MKKYDQKTIEAAHMYGTFSKGFNALTNERLDLDAMCESFEAGRLRHIVDSNLPMASVYSHLLVAFSEARHFKATTQGQLPKGITAQTFMADYTASVRPDKVTGVYVLILFHFAYGIRPVQ